MLLTISLLVTALWVAGATENVEPHYQCHADNKTDLNKWHWRGTNLGGWLVLEPWITPSLFYQFLDETDRWNSSAPEHVALDSYSFCTALGVEEANRQLRIHWDAWVTESHIANLAKIGVDTVRIPVADWMYVPYEPYIGCWDGSLEVLERALGWCKKYNIHALIDVHTMIGSQNPFDNSGMYSLYSI